MKSDSERGPIGVWLRRERNQRGWTPDDVVRRLRDLSYPIRVDYYRGLESGPQKPGPELMAVLQRLYGSTPEAPAPVPTADTGNAAILAALHEQTALLAQLWPALIELTQELRAGRAESSGRDETLVKILARLEAAVTPANTEEPNAPPPGVSSHRSQ